MLKNHGKTFFTQEEIDQYNQGRIKKRQQNEYQAKLNSAVCELEDLIGGGIDLDSSNETVKRIAQEHGVNAKKLAKSYMTLCRAEALLRNAEEGMGLPYGTLDVCMGGGD